MESSDEEDARKPAARPTINTTPPLQNESSSADAVVAVPVDGELPFLVTHWLSEYFGGDQHNAGTMEQQAAVTKIHKAAADLASAFSAIGAFGSSVRVRTSFLLFVSHMKKTDRHFVLLDIWLCLNRLVYSHSCVILNIIVFAHSRH